MNYRRVPVPFITYGNNRHGTYGSALLLLRFELLNECSEVRRNWRREGVVVVLQALPDPQLQPDVNGDGHEQERHQEWDAPSAPGLIKGLIAEVTAGGENHGERHHDPQRR